MPALLQGMGTSKDYKCAKTLDIDVPDPGSRAVKKIPHNNFVHGHQCHWNEQETETIGYVFIRDVNSINKTLHLMLLYKTTQRAEQITKALFSGGKGQGPCPQDFLDEKT